MEGQYIRCLGGLLNSVTELFLHHFCERLILLIQLDPMGRRSPHQVGTAVPEFRRGNGGPSYRNVFITRATCVPRFSLSIDQDGFLSSLGSSFKMEDGTGGSFRGTFS